MNQLPETVFYYGWSMRGVFAVGDRLELASVRFEDLQPGDVVAVAPLEGQQYVHRVIRVEQDYAVTMGDNNRRADENLLSQTSRFKLVTCATAPDGTPRKIPGGAAGMRCFVRHQRRKRRRAATFRILRQLRWLAGLRIPASAYQEFGNCTVFYWRHIPVARLSAAGQLCYLSGWKRIFFRVPAHRVQALRQLTLKSDSAGKPAREQYERIFAAEND